MELVRQKRLSQVEPDQRQNTGFVYLEGKKDAANFQVIDMERATKSEIRNRILNCLGFPMTIWDVHISTGISYVACRSHLLFLFDVGSVHTSINQQGLLMYHKAEFKHPLMKNHLSIFEIEKAAETGKAVSDEEQKNLEDLPGELDAPGFYETIPSTLEED